MQAMVSLDSERRPTGKPPLRQLSPFLSTFLHRLLIDYQQSVSAFYTLPFPLHGTSNLLNYSALCLYIYIPRTFLQTLHCSFFFFLFFNNHQPPRELSKRYSQLKPTLIIDVRLLNSNRQRAVLNENK